MSLFGNKRIGGTIIRSNKPPVNKASQWVDLSTGAPVLKVFNEEVNGWVEVSGGAKTEIVETILNRDNLTNKTNGLRVFVLDATGDQSVSFGYAEYIFFNDEWIKVSEGESLDLSTGGTIGLPISANDISENSNKLFVNSSEKAQIISTSQELTSFGQRLTDVENRPLPTTTDEKVKLNATDTTEGYLEDKIDNSTIQIKNNKLVVKGIDGLTATLQEINSLSGAQGNIQEQINALSSIGNFTTSIATYADLLLIQTPQHQDMVIVIADEQHEGKSTIYIYNGTSWSFAGEFKGGEVRDFTTNPINLSTETTSILPKSKYEKQNAAETPFTDSTGNIKSLNTEDAIKELFTYANNMKSVATVIGSPLTTSDTSEQMKSKIELLKTNLASAISDKGVPTYPYNTLDEMANKIKVIPNVNIAGTVKATSKINVISPYQYSVILNEPLSVEDICTTVLQYVGNDSGNVHYNAEYNNGEASSFTYNPDNVVFDGFMRLKDEWIYNLNPVEVDSLYETNEIDFTQFNDFGADLMLDYDNKKFTLKGLKSTSEIVIANGNISLIGVEFLDKINWVNVVSGNGAAKLAISFDSGLTFVAYNGYEWVTVNVNDKDDFKSKGMSKSIVDALTNTELSVAREDSNVIRFAYYIERPLYADESKNDKISLSVTMKGYNVIANTADYSYRYNPHTKTLTYEFKKNGTFMVNFVDG